MLFNSISFALFLPVVFLLHWIISKNKLRQQNIVLLIASYFFYGFWDYRFLFLLLFSTVLDYVTGIMIYRSSVESARKIWLLISIFINLGFLATFKYFNFFAESFVAFLNYFGFKSGFVTLNIILPVGISFYTFHGLSYIIDIYKRKIVPEYDFVIYSLFVSFFPLLVAGPIERATHLLPQLKESRSFSYSGSVSGLRQILWGLFKKVVIADNCSVFVNDIFMHHASYSSITLFLGALLFAVQIYGDFSGYSDIALGTARLFGVELLQNFSYPYFSRDIAEFWRRWHISLSSWFRDYVYVPLGGSKVSVLQKVRNVMIIFLLSGFWHGANWTFLFWGLLNAIYFLPLILLNKNRENVEIVAYNRSLPTVKELLSILTTFTLTTFAWVFFRSPNVRDALSYIGRMLSPSEINLSFDSELLNDQITIYSMAILIFGFFLVEWLGRKYKYPIAIIDKTLPKALRWGFYYVLILLLFIYQGPKSTFIYFQF
jgi:D-alanyl-lipoteichoic acid acyltransferase DltB (MBOAT superfamily)